MLFRSVEALKQVAIRANSSFISTLTAAFKVWLHQLTRQSDLVLGLPTAGQLAVDQYNLVGHCVHLLPLRSRYEPQQPFLSFVEDNRDALLDAYEHQTLTFGSLLQKLAISRDPGRVPLVPVVFNADLSPEKGIFFSGLQQRLISNPRAFENFELSVNVLGRDTGLSIYWSYNTYLFSAQTINRFNKSFEDLLAAVAQQPTAPLVSIGIALDQATSGHPSGVINSHAYPREKAITTLIAETATGYPHKVAVRFGADYLTYQALDNQANQVGHALRALGVCPGDRVGLAVERSLPLLTVMLGIMKAGATYVPVDPLHPADRLSFIMNDAGCELVITSRLYAGRITQRAGRELTVEDIWQTVNTYPSTPPEQGPTGQDIAYILYTSGTTGRPKGALIRHHSVANVLFSVVHELELTNADKTIALATIAFDLATVELYTPLLVGAELLLIDSATARNAEALADVLRDPSITFVQTTPATFRLLLAAGWRGHSQLRAISCAEALPLDLAQTLLGCCAKLWNYYGPTETTIYATGKRILPGDQQITIGSAIANTRIYLVDEVGQLARDGQPGEICIAGDGVSGVYVNQPELTAQKFIDNPFAHQPEKLYRTGDLGRYVAGSETTFPDVIYMGRLDQQVKIRGFRIELGEIEQVLRNLPTISEVIVLAREDTPGEQRLVAYVVLQHRPADEAGLQEFAPAGEESVSAWRRQAALLLPDYMIPADFVLLPSLPITANGKLDRSALPAPAASRPSRSQAEASITSTLLDSPEEQLILSLWKEALRTDHVAPDDNFFAIGGHSLIAVKIMAQLATITGRRLPLSALFEYPTVRALASLLQQKNEAASWKSLVPIKPTGTRKPLYIVHGAGLNVLLFNAVAHNLHPSQPIFGLQARGLNGVDEPFYTIEEMAAHYISEIVAHDPEGPYLLSGFSFGGIVAYEMARQLLEQGKQIALVALFDTEAFEATVDKPWWVRQGKQVTLLFRKIGHTATLLRKQRSRGLTYKMESIDRKLIKRYWLTKGSHRFDHVVLRQGIEMYWRIKFGEEQQQEVILDTKFKIEAINDVALAKFVLKPADLEVHVFRAMVQTFYIADVALYGWKNFARKGMHIHDVPGEHSYIFAPPNDKAFARKLQAVLDGLNQEGLSDELANNQVLA